MLVRTAATKELSQPAATVATYIDYYYKYTCTYFWFKYYCSTWYFFLFK